MQFRDLGPLLVTADGVSRTLAGKRLSAILAILLAHADEPVSANVLVDVLWGEAASDRSGKVLESHIWRLRKLLEPDRGPRAAPTVLLTESLGYRLAATAETADSLALTRAHRLVRAAVDTHDLDTRLTAAAPALTDWRGEFCADVDAGPALDTVRQRLSEQRLDLVEWWADALIESGQPERAVSELSPVIGQFPLREPLWGLRMIGLYRSGRQAAALDAYTDVRRRLIEELGIEPGPALAALHERILRQDEALLLSVSSPVPPSVSMPPPKPMRPLDIRLPSRRSSIVGRADDLRTLAAALETDQLVTITGPGGVGKTRLAVEFASTERSRYPDGVHFVDLGEIASAGSIPAVVADICGVRPEAGRPLDEIVIGQLASKRALLILDNCEHVVDGVAVLTDRLLEAGKDIRLLATSRQPLDVDGERVVGVAPLVGPAADLDAEVRGLDPTVLHRYPAVGLFLDRLGDAHAPVDVTGSDGVAIARICAAVGGLPLGIELAAARARTFALGEIADSIEAAPSRISRSGSGPERHSSLLRTVDWGYQLAGYDEQVLHRRFSVLSGPFTLEAAVELCSVPPLERAGALEIVGNLVHRSLLVVEPPQEHRRRTLFLQLVPIRSHAASTLTTDERLAMEAARNRWIIDRLRNAPEAGAAEQAAHYDWLTDNQSTVREVLRSTLVDSPDPVGLDLLWRLIFFWHDREQFVDLLRWSEVATAAVARMPHSPFDAAVASAVAGCALAMVHDTDAGRPLLDSSISVLSSAPRERRRDAARMLIVIATAAWSGDDFPSARRAAHLALELGAAEEQVHTTLVARGILAAGTLVGGDPGAAVVQAQQLLDDNIRVGNNLAALFAHVTQSIAAKFAGDGRAGLRHCDDALRTQYALGTHNFAESFETRGHHLATAGRADGAARAFGLSHALSTRQGREWPWHPGTAETVDAVRDRLGTDFGIHWDSGVRTAELGPDQLIAGVERD